jgi:hypothetical protein
MHSEVPDETSVQCEFAALNRLREFTGRYYRALGWIDLASSIIALAIWYWTGHLAITFSFVFWFWLGTCLKQGSSAARKWAIVIPILNVIPILSEILYPELRLKLTPWGIDHTHPAFFPLAGIYLVVYAIPGLMLAGDHGRRVFSK